MNTKYKKILPADVFIPVSDPSFSAVGKDDTDIISRLLGIRPTGNNFIDLFAGVIHQHRNLQVHIYAKMMDVDLTVFSPAVVAMTGMGPHEWIHAYLDLVSCELLEKTNLSITEIGKKLHFPSLNTFTQFFYQRHKCRPYEWRSKKRTGKKRSYHT